MSARRRPLCAADLSLLRLAAEPALSPDGQSAAFTLAHFEANERQSDVWLVSAGAAARALTTDGMSESLAFSPDGRTVAFLSRREGRACLCLVEPAAQGDDAGGRVLARFEGEPRRPVWSPDGHRIALEVLDGAPDPLAPRVVRRLRYNVNGHGFIGDRRWRVVLVDAGTGAVSMLGDPRFHHFCPAFSPDGARLALVTTRREDWDLEWVWDVYDVDLAVDRWHRLSASDGLALYPAFSPDGTRVAFLHNHSPHTGTTSDYHVLEVPSDGGQAPHCLSHAFDRGATGVYEVPIIGGGPPAYDAQGQHVLWLANDRGRHVLCRSACDESGTEVVLEHVGWPVLAADRTRAAALLMSDRRPPEVARLNLAAGRAEVLTDLNPWLGERLLSQTPIRYPLGDASGQAEAVLWRPPAEAAPRPPYRTVVQFHGGPHGAFGPYFNVLEQMLAGHGYLVASLNYRGSAGYGQAFADLVHADWGPKEGEDGVRLIERLAADGLADGLLVGVYGISYGGFMTNWMATRHPSYVGAAVSISTVTSLFTSAYGIDHWESIATDMGGVPWEIPDYYREHSPASYLDRVEAPMLILHGEADMTCPLIEAEILFVGLRWQRKVVEFVRYPGEHHSFLRSGRLATMIDAHARTLAWFVRHLGTGAAAVAPGEAPT